MKKTNELGRTLADLMKENIREINDNEEIVDINVHKIVPNPDQPRIHFSDHRIAELAQSIQKHGVLQPIIVKPAQEGFVLVAGERRLRAARKIGNTTIPAIIRNYQPKYLAELALLENLQREDLNPIEEAAAYKLIIEKTNITHAEMAEKVGVSRSHITNMIGLFKLPIQAINDLKTHTISMGHARILSKIKDEKFLLKLLDQIKSENLTVRDLEKIAKSKTYTSSKIPQLESHISKRYKLNVKALKKGRTILMSFDSQKDIERFLMKLEEKNDK